VVNITSKTPITSNSSNQSTSNTLGSGFVYDKQGHIVTNSHVVGDAKLVDVTFPDGNRYTAKVIATDVYGDIAVLQISQNTSQSQRQLLSSLKPLVLGNSSNLEVGDTVIAIGNPFGESDRVEESLKMGSSIGDVLHTIIRTIPSQDYTKYIRDPEMNLLTDVHDDWG
jgi:S1-C subfamily serine protease